MSDPIPERDWREKQKAMDDLIETVELQRKALENLQKDIMEKEKLCSALRVSMLMFLFIVECLRFCFGLYFYPLHRLR